MSGSVKLDCYDKLTTHVNAEAIVADFNSTGVDVRRIVRAIFKIEWTGYDDSDGKVFLQLSDDNVDFQDWGGTAEQGTMSTASGNCIFAIWQGVPGFIRARVELGSGSAATVSVNYRLKYG